MPRQSVITIEKTNIVSKFSTMNKPAFGLVFYKLKFPIKIITFMLIYLWEVGKHFGAYLFMSMLILSVLNPIQILR